MKLERLQRRALYYGCAQRRGRRKDVEKRDAAGYAGGHQ